ncbi:MAG: hypothetical protein IKK46_02545 [Clostridia bacterium]|nr:hypothetical protein [Clostridia bacterium]
MHQRILKRKRKKAYPIEELVEALYDKQLSFTDYEIVKVIYNSDKTKRFIILKSSTGFYKYTYEEICVLDEDEWKYCCDDANAYPALWETRDKSSAASFFGTENEAFLSMKQESEYILHFDRERNMKTIEKDDWKFSVDVEKTKAYYKTHSLCECSNCRNFYAQIEEKLPKLKEFLSEFGVDVSKPDESSSIELENSIDYLSVDYTVCGEIIEASKYEIDIYDNLFLSIVVNDDFVCPNEQTGKFFTFSVFQIELPWVLDEPLNSTVKKRVFDKSHGIFKKKSRSR